MADELRNPFTGQTIRFLEESPELLVMESGDPPRRIDFDMADYEDVFRLS